MRVSGDAEGNAQDRPRIHVVAGVFEDSQGRILIAKRPDEAHQGGLWEFPGGKLEVGETPPQGLVRELFEELGVRVRSSDPLIQVSHRYGDRDILLDVHRVTAYTGEPHGREGQPLDWVHPEDMAPAAFPPADRPIIMALRLPKLYLITGDDPRRAARFLERLSRVLAGGIRLVQLRAHCLNDRDYARLAATAFRLCERHGARLVLNRDPAQIGDLPGHGLHLNANRLTHLARRPLGAEALVGASCHNGTDLQVASRLGLDYALLSPVRVTASHPQARPMGWDRFATLVAPASLPVYALGGLGPDDLEQAVRRGAQGIAAIGKLWCRGH